MLHTACSTIMLYEPTSCLSYHLLILLYMMLFLPLCPLWVPVLKAFLRLTSSSEADGMAHRAWGCIGLLHSLRGNSIGSSSRLQDKCFNRRTLELSGCHRHSSFGWMSVYAHKTILFKPLSSLETWREEWLVFLWSLGDVSLNQFKR